MSDYDYRPFLPYGAKIAGASARAHAQARLAGPRASGLFAAWEKLFAQPFVGMTHDGAVIPDLYAVAREGAPTAAMAQAASALLATMSAQEKAGAVFPIDSPQWRRWQNTELHVEQHGLRLDETGAAQREAALNLMRVSLSARGYELARDVMRLNHYLGELVGGVHVMGEFTYIVCLYGTPSTSEPWGWQLFGHHLAINCFVLGEQMTLTPAFWGAEPTIADHGPHKGLHLFADEERGGLELMRAFDARQRERAIVAHSMMGGDLPEGRRHFADNLNLGGAYQDNRIVPYEGLRGDAMSVLQQRTLLDLAARYIDTLPAGPFAARMAQIEQRLADTHFCWIGGHDEHSPFYYRIQSPVIFIEFDHHAGVYLTNEQPAKFHVHTVVRTPNGNDYGLDLLRQHYRDKKGHHHQGGHAGGLHRHADGTVHAHREGYGAHEH